MEGAGEVFARQGTVQLAEIAADDRLQIGIQRSGGGALELADFRQDLRGTGDMRVRPEGACRRQRRALVRGIGIGVDENDGQRFGARFAQCLCGRAYLVRLDRRAYGAVGQGALGHFQTQVPIDHRNEIAPQAPGLPPVPPAHFQNIAEPGRGDQANTRTLAFEQRIGADGRAVHDGPQMFGRAECLQAGEKPHRLVAAVGRRLADGKPSCGLIEVEEIREGSADIDANHRAHARAVT
jgi:hypothetical protein